MTASPASSVDSLSTTATGHAVVLLAAGGSRRLGQPKQLLIRAGIPLIRWLAECALTTRPERMLAVVGRDRTAIAEALAGLPLTLVNNADWSSGLASSLQMAAAALADWPGAVLLLACDQPQLQAEHLQRLLQAHRVGPGAVTVTDYGDGHGAGIPVLVPASVLAAATALQGDIGLKRLWQSQSLNRVLAPELAVDLDTPADVARAVAAGWLDACAITPAD